MQRKTINRRLSRRQWIVAATTAIGTVALASPGGDHHDWVGGASQLWHEAANWDPAEIPGTGDTVSQDLKTARTSAREARLKANRALSCSICENRDAT